MKRIAGSKLIVNFVDRKKGSFFLVTPIILFLLFSSQLIPIIHYFHSKQS